MNSQTTTTLLIASILAFALLANISAPVFATGGLDDEEEEEAIEELQDAVEEIQSAVGAIELNLVPGANDITANCPPVTTNEEEKETPEAVVPQEENNTNSNNNNNNETQEQEQQPQCPLAPSVEPEVPTTTVIPSVQNNNTVGCSPVTEEEEELPAVEEQNQTSELEPIICPINGDLLGYTNTTSGEQLPISAVLEDEQNNGTIPFLPPIQLPPTTEEEEEPEQNQTVTTQTPSAEEELPSCNVTQSAEEQQQPTITLQDEQPIASIEYEASCGCFVVDKSPEEVQ